MKMKYLVYIILTLIMASLAFGVYLYKQKISEIPLETESKPKLEWVTYNDDIYRFSFEYLKK
ncbi:MAG: hypothetical protein UZ19_OD1000601 [Parcubacteria bacterium OLB19]|nr:MAG: hypothetical protein UZ19_OD1000601 [Parcubacteria bacterium OLB19]